MTMATKLKAKINDLQARTERLARCGGLTDKTKMELEEEMERLGARLDKLDRKVTSRLATVEQRILDSQNQLAFA